MASPKPPDPTPTRRRGAGSGPQISQPDPFANDAALAAALAAPNQATDMQQQQQNSSSAGLDRMTSPYAATMSDGAGTADVWVTVPVDKVSVANGKGTVTPAYATGKGYQTPPAGANIPPTPAVGRP